MTLAKLLEWLNNYGDDSKPLPEHVMRQVFYIKYHLNRIYPSIKELED